MTNTIHKIPTPFVLVDESRLDRNLKAMQVRADQNGCLLRPHIKTHKSVFIARKQLDQGARGITVAKPSEAMVFLEAGFTDIAIAYPMVSELRILEVMRASNNKTQVYFSIDSEYGLKKLISAARKSDRKWPVYLIVDSGFHRCGVSPDSDALLYLAEMIETTNHLTLHGLLTHGGQAYDAKNRKEATAACREEIHGLVLAQRRIKDAGLGSPLLSIGSTPGILSGADLRSVDEIRPGNYVFLDRTPLKMGLCNISDLSLSVIASIVSQNDRYWIADAGSKTLSSDGGAHGMTGQDGFGLVYPLEDEVHNHIPAVIARLSEEHGWIHRVGQHNFRIGDRIRIFPNHSCVIPNLSGDYYLKGVDGTANLYPVDARGCLQ